MAKDRAGNDFVTLVNTPGGFFTPATAPAKTVTETDLDKIVDNLLKDVDVPLFERDDLIEDLLERDGLAARARRETVDTTRA